MIAQDALISEVSIGKEAFIRLGDFYSRRLLPTAILVWVCAIIFIALAAYSAMQFFKADLSLANC